MEKILEAKNITKNYPGVVALDDVNFNVYKGKVNVLDGENGAGKSTLMKILSGVEKQTSGDILLNDKKPCVLALGGGAFLNKKLQKIVLLHFCF